MAKFKIKFVDITEQVGYAEVEAESSVEAEKIGKQIHANSDKIKWEAPEELGMQMYWVKPI